MSVRPTLDVLLHEPNIARKLPRPALIELMAEAAAVQSIIVSGLTAASSDSESAKSDDDHLLTVGEAATRLNTTKDWIYRHSSELPFEVRVGGKLRFSARGLQEYIRAKRVRL
jgi:excisionase family DNA binding protein